MKEKTFSEIEQEAWDQRAGYYDELFGPISKQAIPYLLDGSGSLAGKRHLDVACGTGHLVAEASRRGATSEGIDFAGTMIEAARENYPGQIYSQADAARLPFDDEAFDAVTCAFGLSHLENPQEGVDEAFRVLAPGGIFAFTLWYGPNDGNEFLAIVKEAVAAHAVASVSLPESWTQLRIADEQLCASLVQQAGFGRPDFGRLPIVGTYKKREDVLANVDKISIRGKMIIDSQPPAVGQRIKEAIIGKAEAHRTNGVISLNWPALLVTVQKPRQEEEIKMLKQAEAWYTLFDSVEEMLSPESFSSLLSKQVSQVERRPMDNHNGLAGGRLSYVDTDNGRYVLKRMSIESDWLMYATGDQRGRSVRLWQYGLLDRLSPHLEHLTIACAYDGEGWAILMHDLSAGIFAWDQPGAENVVLQFLDALARTHATFWNDPILKEESIGLCDSAGILNGSSLPVASKRPIPNEFNSPIAEWVEEGWEIMADLLDRDVFEQMYRLIEDPRPLFAALDRYPHTLLHGDFRDANLAVLPQERLVAFDWQFATRSLMTVDLAWFINDIRDLISLPQAHSFYRERLEGYLEQKLDDQHWEAMLDLGYLVNALRSTCLSAYFSKHGDNPEWRKSERAEVMEKGQQVRNALRWL